MTGVLLSGMDTTIVVLALPALERSLNAALTSLVWLVIGFLLVNTLLTTQAGRLGDMFGPARVYKTGFALFTLASLLCGLAWDVPSLVVFRLLQGVGTACVTANSGAIIASVFSRGERGKAYGNTGVAFSLGAVLGIVLGGLLVTYVSWRWIFWINVPIGIAVMACSRTVLRERARPVRRNLDLVGMVTLGAGLLCVIWAVTELATHTFRPLIAGSLACGAVLLAVFAWNERSQAEPMLRFSLFRIPGVSAPLLAALFQGLANYAVLWLAIMYLQGPKGLSPLDTALLLMPGYVLAGLICLVSGRLADRFGPLLPVLAGLGAEIVALLTFAQISPSSGLWLLVAANTANGIGLGFFIPANSSAVMKAAPQEFVGISSGMLRSFAGIGWVFSFPLVMMFASRSISRERAVSVFVGSAKLDGRLAAVFTSGLSSSFYALSGIMVLAVLASLIRLAGRSVEPDDAGEQRQQQLRQLGVVQPEPDGDLVARGKARHAADDRRGLPHVER
ncbi:MFS transporter [Streptomyces daliensis]|uniref:MFS transporter n=1 Tax=Streptomyces daliensis TaxID=299421 RepID=A0A8T4ILR4_9ACTN|nr:MFS transporter [Streptomyces daliensis]